jgi:hypothetical protein
MELLDVPTAPAGAAATERMLATKSPDVAAKATSVDAVVRTKGDFMTLPTFFWKPDEVSGEKDADVWTS